MSVAVDLADVKAALRIMHNDDDEALIRLIGAALIEFINYADNPEYYTENDIPVGEDVFQGIVLMVQSGYEGDPEKRRAMRYTAEQLWRPSQVGFGL